MIKNNAPNPDVADTSEDDDDDGLVFKPKNEKMNKKKLKNPVDNKKPYIMMLSAGVVSLIAGIILLIVAFVVIQRQVAEYNFPDLSSESEEVGTQYSPLTGLALTAGQAVNAPTYCVQTPNGTDGARPQAGLTQAGVIFEAIAEAGITRFAAIYQNPTSAVIGPIRSLRIYYLEWDTPFDCTIVHAGGSADALAAVAQGYKNHDENYTYMYRGGYSYRLWNNLFTTSSYLQQNSTAAGNTTSDVTGFTRMTPLESEKARAEALANEKLDITAPASGDTSATSVPVSSVSLQFGNYASFNVDYHYDVETNTYPRSYASGAVHEVYSCPDSDLGEVDPEDNCTLTQMAPSVVIAMVVEESRASDNYHEDITAIGSGTAYIFQNGTAITGTWSKSSADSQIKFTDENGTEIKLAPGQTFISAVPDYGSVIY